MPDNIFSFVKRLADAVPAAVKTASSNVYIVSSGTENKEVEGEGLTWEEAAIASGQVDSSDNFSLQLPGTGEYVSGKATAQYGVEVRIIQTEDSKG